MHLRALHVLSMPLKDVSGICDCCLKGDDMNIDLECSLSLTFFPSRAVIRVPIVDDNDYEKNEYFFIELGQPTLIEREGKWTTIHPLGGEKKAF